MRAGLAFLVAAYVLSQFYRACLAVMSPVLGAELGITPGDLATSSALWFLSFTLMQFPVGWALDRIGPRRTAGWLVMFGAGGGAAVFAVAAGPGALHMAMVLIGAGCAPVLMAAYFIFARSYCAQVFGTLAGVMVGVGSLGNIAGAAPLAWMIGAVGWRGTMAGLAIAAVGIGLAVLILVRDPERVAPAQGQEGRLRDVIAIRALWPILAMMLVAYAPAAAIRGLWAGPYLEAVYGTDAAGIGRATLVMGLAMVAGNFLLGPIDRLVGSLKWGIVASVALSALFLGLLAAFPANGFWTSALLLAGHGFFGATYPAIMTHGRRLLPPHLLGRGVSFINMFSIGGAGLMQFASRPVYQTLAGGPAGATFGTLFLFFLVPLLAGLVIYLFSRDNRA